MVSSCIWKQTIGLKDEDLALIHCNPSKSFAWYCSIMLLYTCQRNI